MQCLIIRKNVHFFKNKFHWSPSANAKLPKRQCRPMLDAFDMCHSNEIRILATIFPFNFSQIRTNDSND